MIRQRLREAERETLFDEFAHREGEIITGTVSRVEPRGVILDLGKAEAVLPTTDQSATEHYRIGQHVKAFVMEVRRTTRGPLIYVSRTHKNFLRRLFELEVPEIHAGTVEIKAIAREAGSRSKVAVASRQDGLDPVGATVGQRGGRVQAVVAELGGEKIDVIPWSDDPGGVRGQRAEPAQVVGVDIDEDAPHRVRDRARADALARDRARGPERPARRQAHRLADRHPERPGAGSGGRRHGARSASSRSRRGPQRRPPRRRRSQLEAEAQPVAVAAEAEAPRPRRKRPQPRRKRPRPRSRAGKAAAVGGAPAGGRAKRRRRAPRRPRPRSPAAVPAVRRAGRRSGAAAEAAPAAKPAASRKRTRRPAEASEVSS